MRSAAGCLRITVSASPTRTARSTRSDCRCADAEQRESRETHEPCSKESAVRRSVQTWTVCADVRSCCGVPEAVRRTRRMRVTWSRTTALRSEDLGQVEACTMQHANGDRDDHGGGVWRIDAAGGACGSRRVACVRQRHAHHSATGVRARRGLDRRTRSSRSHSRPMARQCTSIARTAIGASSSSWRPTFEGGAWQPPCRCRSRPASSVTSIRFFIGDRLYFSSNRPRPGSPTTDFDTWYVTRTGATWSEPVHVDGAPSGPGNQLFVSIARDGTLYFQSDATGGGDIYRAERVGDAYPVAAPLEGISTAASESNPAISRTAPCSCS